MKDNAKPTRIIENCEQSDGELMETIHFIAKATADMNNWVDDEP